MANVSREQRRITKDRLLTVASRLFTEQGFANTTVREIAHAAEVSESSIFTYFDTKDGLLMAIVVPQISDISVVVPLDTPWQTLTELMRIHFRRIDSIDRRLLHEFLAVFFRATYYGESDFMQRMEMYDRRFFDAARETLTKFELDTPEGALEIVQSIYVASFVAYTTQPQMQLEEFLASANRQFAYVFSARWNSEQQRITKFITVPG
jgi:AcrR family transcriptional regulator